MKATILTASVAALSIGSVDVREVAVGPLEVGRLVLDSVQRAGRPALRRAGRHEPTGRVTAPSADRETALPEENP